MTDAAEDVDVLEREAEAATALAEELEKRYIDGDESVQPEQIAEQEKLGRWARLKAQRAQVAAEKAKADARMAAIRALRAEIEQTELRVGGQIADVLEEIDAVEAKLLTLTDAHDERVGQWRQRAEALNVQAASGSQPLEAEGGIMLGHSGSPITLKVGSRLQVQRVGGRALLEHYRTSSERPAIRADIRSRHGEVSAE